MFPTKLSEATLAYILGVDKDIPPQQPSMAHLINNRSYPPSPHRRGILTPLPNNIPVHDIPSDAAHLATLLRIADNIPLQREFIAKELNYADAPCHVRTVTRGKENMNSSTSTHPPPPPLPSSPLPPIGNLRKCRIIYRLPQKLYNNNTGSQYVLTRFLTDSLPGDIENADFLSRCHALTDTTPGSYSLQWAVPSPHCCCAPRLPYHGVLNSDADVDEAFSAFRHATQHNTMLQKFITIDIRIEVCVLRLIDSIQMLIYLSINRHFQVMPSFVLRCERMSVKLDDVHQ